MDKILSFFLGPKTFISAVPMHFVDLFLGRKRGEGHRDIYIYIYIHPAGLRGGPKTIRKSAAREPAKSCEGARSESRRPKRYKNRGLRTSQKSVENMFFRRSGGPLMTPNGTRWRFSIRFGLPRSSSFCAVFQPFLGFWQSGRGAEIARTLRFCGFRVWWRFWALFFFFFSKKWPPKMREKICVEKNGAKLVFVEKRCKISVSEPCFGPFLAHRFWGWVFLRCGARFWAPTTRGKCRFEIRTSWSGTKTGPFSFLGRSPCGAVRFAADISALPAVCEFFGGNGRDAWQNLTSSATNPWKLRKEAFFGLGGFRCMISPNFAEKMVHHKIRFLEGGSL